MNNVFGTGSIGWRNPPTYAPNYFPPPYTSHNEKVPTNLGHGRRASFVRDWDFSLRSELVLWRFLLGLGESGKKCTKQATP